MLWEGFRAEDDTLIDTLCELCQMSEYSSSFSVEISDMVDFTQSVMAHYELCIMASVESSRIASIPRDSSASIDSRRLPEIPLPHFSGDIHQWPAFRNRLDALVTKRENLSNIEKFHYLVGCLQDSATDVVCGIPVSGPTYEIAWEALVARFDKPRVVASALVDKSLQAPASAKESLTDLNNFLSLFNEGESVLKSLKMPDLGNFILYSLAARCLPPTCRTLFESLPERSRV